MILDKQNLIINNVPVSGLVASTTYTADSTAGTPLLTPSGSIGSIDLGKTVPNRRVGRMKLMAQIQGGVVAGTASLNITLYNSATPTAATTQIVTTGTVAAATMVAGYEFPIEIPESTIFVLRYLVATVVTGAGAGSGSALINFGLVPEGATQTANFPT